VRRAAVEGEQRLRRSGFISAELEQPRRKARLFRQVAFVVVVVGAVEEVAGVVVEAVEVVVGTVVELVVVAGVVVVL
jgi:hypothetical protein